MKWFLGLAFIAFVFYGNTQEINTYKVEIKLTSKNGTLPGIIDTLFLNKEYKTNAKFYTQVAVENGVVVLPAILNGKYLLKFSIKDFFVLPVPVTVCAKCENRIEVQAKSMEGGENNFFTMVEVGPSYIDGFKGLRKDFKKTLSKKEMKKLKELPPDVGLHFFVTKDGAVSDITFSKEPSTEVKDIIFKGLYSLKNWRLAMVNGRTMDGEYVLNKEDLL